MTAPPTILRRVRIRQAAFAPSTRPHLSAHAFRGDVGVVLPAPPATIYAIVAFDVCGKTHRLLEGELEDA